MKKIFKLNLLLIMILQTNISLASDKTIDYWMTRITGTWQGSMLMAPETEVTIQFIISEGEDGSFTVILNSPDHDAIKNVKANSVKYTRNPRARKGVLKFDVAELKGSYKGVVKDSRIKGSWKQEGTSFPLDMAPQKDIYEADVTATTFFDLMQNSQFGKAYTFMSEGFKSITSKKQFAEQSQNFRDQHGITLRINLFSSKYADEMGGGTDKDDVEILFWAHYVKEKQPKEEFVERIIMANEKGEWKVSSFSSMPIEEYRQMQAQKAEMQKEANAAEIK